MSYANTPLFLGIDCGTQGTKAVVLDIDSGQVLGEGSAPHSMISDASGRREQDPAEWVAALEQATRSALAVAGVAGERIRGIGVSGQQHGLVLLDAEGQVLRPAKLWCDTETAPENQRLLDYLGGEAGSLQRLGIAIAPGYTLSKLLWTKERHPQVFERIERILLPHDYLNYWLTGRCCTEPGDASGTGYFDIRRRDWDRPLLDHIDPSGRLSRALPELLDARAPVGRLRPEIAQRLGLSDDVLVSSGGGDNMMGAIGTGNIEAGLITMSLGSSGTVYACADQPRISEHPSVATFCSSAGDWLPLICTMNLTNVTAAVRQLLALDLDAFNRALDQAPIGAQGVMMLPFLNGERVPALPHATGSILGLDSTNLTAANLCRAAVEGTTFGLRYGLDLLRASGIRSETIRLTGGGSKSAIWRQLVADIMDTPVICPVYAEAAALGAAIQAAWCWSASEGQALELSWLCERCVHLDPASETTPQVSSVAAYETLYQNYRARVSAL